MDDLVRIFKSPTGDVYHISLVEDEGLLSTEALQAIGPVRLVGIEPYGVEPGIEPPLPGLIYQEMNILTGERRIAETLNDYIVALLHKEHKLL